MEVGTIVEYIDRKKIICAAVVQAKKQKVRLITESNREVSVSENRLFGGSGRLDPAMGRDRMAAILAGTARARESLKKEVSVEELWESLHTESEWIDAETLASFSFPPPPDHDRVSAVIRALFEDRIFFRFDVTRFFPHTPEEVEQAVIRAEKEAARERRILEGGLWLKSALAAEAVEVPPEHRDTVEILKDFYLFDKESHHGETAREILAVADLSTGAPLFNFLVKTGEWNRDENLDIPRLGVPVAFSEAARSDSASLAASPGLFTEHCERRDFTGLPIITIDGQATSDFDDALSLETDGDTYRVGIHISDVAHFIQKDSALDAEARLRASSIYLPDQKIPMLPPNLAEGLLSLKADSVRPAISVMATVTPEAEVLEFEVVPSLIRVRRQLTYYDANIMSDADKEIIVLSVLAKKLREARLNAGAVNITLPEVNVWVDEFREVGVHRINRESVSRMLVSEFMILGNRLMAKFLAQNRCPAVFRSQPEPKQRLFSRDEGTLFENWMQRKHLSRFLLSPEPAPHSGLGVEAYVTATSPIRKYFDLVTQRQIRAVLGIEKPSSRREIEDIIVNTQEPLSRVVQLQGSRVKYWIIKYLEKRMGQKEHALVLEQRRDRTLVLLTDVMMEAALTGVKHLAPQDEIFVVVKKADPRALEISLALG